MQSPAKVLYVNDGRFLLHQHGKVVLQRRTPDSMLSASWLIISKQFGTVHLQAFDNRGALHWLSCELDLVRDATKACLFWMTAAEWDHWSSSSAGQFVLKRHIDDGMFLSAAETGIRWSHEPMAFHVADWVPEACPLRGMAPSPHSYHDAKGEVTFTMTTFFKVYARSIMFRQALSSVFTYLKERDFYVREFLVINDWYPGRSLDFNGTFSGPGVHESRREMLDFFPGCEGNTVEQASQRPAEQKCTFVFKSRKEQGQPKALNILLDLMKTKFWIQFEDDHVFYQNVYISRLLFPMYEAPESCWNYERRRELQRRARTPLLSAMRKGRTGDHKGSDGHDHHADSSVDERRLGNVGTHCKTIGSVLLGSRPPDGTPDGEDLYEVTKYTVPERLFNHSYVRELLAHGGFDTDKKHSWGSFEDVGAVRWPLFSLRPAVHNLTYIKKLEAPLFYDGRPGRFSEDPNITRWPDGGKTYAFRWDFELEFAVRWARKGAVTAKISPGACMRDVSNGISSFERSNSGF